MFDHRPVQDVSQTIPLAASDFELFFVVYPAALEISLIFLGLRVH